MADFSTVACSEIHGTREEGLSYKGGPTAKVSLECAYADRFLLREDLINNGYWPYTSDGGYAPRCQSVTVRPEPTTYEQDGQAITYETAVLDVDYSYDQSAGSNSGGGAGGGRQLYTETFENQLELLELKMKDVWINTDPADQATLPGNPGPGRKKIKTLPAFREYSMSLRRVYYNWVSVPSTFVTLLNTVNNAEVTFPSIGIPYPKETLLFLPRSSNRSVSTDGTAGYTVSVDFIYKKETWNKFPAVRLDGTVRYLPYWTKVTDQTGNVFEVQYKPFKLGDFSDWVF